MREDDVLFNDRSEAGRRLATRLKGLAGQGVVVLGLPRGGVPVAAEVAEELDAPLDVIVVRKLGVPFQPELAMGAIGEGGATLLDDDVRRRAGVSAEAVAEAELREEGELAARARRYRGDRRPVALEGRVAVVVDDGVATGSSAKVACEVARRRGAGRVVMAVPVGPPGIETAMAGAADEVVCLDTPERFFAVGQYYRDFSQVSDEEVIARLEAARLRAEQGRSGPPAGVSPGEVEGDVEVGADGRVLPGRLVVPRDAVGVVAFAHGSGSSRHSPRNRFVAATLEKAGMGTLLFDLLAPEEEADRATVFDVELLARRLTDATRWLAEGCDATAGLPVGYFGASTGAAGALLAATDPALQVTAIVSRGGRPDLVSGRLAEVTAPTLLVVGSRDEEVLELNLKAQAELTCTNRLVVVPGAAHLFEEPGTLQAVADLAAEWFWRYFANSR
ncbi:MAG TPA: phosphoribosyltransferase family protein [Acidimicrobiales bacterium]|nr:phosphoribosyltransferase family protein [Acidimicrobiales bacterium]